MVIIQRPKDFLERNDIMSLIYYFNRKVPIVGYYEPEVVYWILQYENQTNKHTQAELGSRQSAFDLT